MMDTFHSKILLTIPQVSERLAISRAMAYRLVQEKQLPAIHINRSVRVREEDLETFIERHHTGNGKTPAIA